MILDTRQRLAAAVLAGYAALSIAYALRIAPGNAPDERAHAEYAESLARGALPVWDWPAKPYSYESFQPPLYYALAALALKASDGLPPLARLRAMRLVSISLHAGALILLWRISRRLCPDSPLGPLCLMASLPMFTFIGSSVTNDAAANFAGAALLCLAVETDAVGETSLPAVLGAALGIAFLCKLTVLSQAAVCVFALWKGKKINARGLAVAGAMALCIGGWLYLRNWISCGNPMGFNRLQAYDPNRFAFSDSGRWLILYFQSFWGRFGWMTSPMAPLAYALAALISVPAVAGWLKHWPRLMSLPGRRLLLGAWLLSLAQNFHYGFFLSYQPQARFSFVALPAWALLFWDGLSSWEKDWPRARTARWAAVATLAALNAFAWARI